MRAWIRKPLGATLVAAAIAATATGGIFVVAPIIDPPLCDRNATTANFSTQVTATQPGETLCLASGSYGNWLGTSKSAPGITIREDDGATVTFGSFTWDTQADPANFTLEGITYTGGLISGPTHDVTIKDSVQTGYLQINPGQSGLGGVNGNNVCGDCPAMNNNDIVFDGVEFTLSSCPTGSCLGLEGRVSFVFTPPSNPAGVQIKNSEFQSGCGDGVFFGGGAGRGVTIGPNNEFHNLQQGSCGPHVDPIQWFGANPGGVVIDGNYFHDASTGIMSYDETTANVTITDNVLTGITGDGGTNVIGLGGTINSLIEHNVVVGSGKSINFGSKSGEQSTGNTVRNNISTNGITNNGVVAGTFAQNDYNLCSANCAGANSIVGAPTFVGGSTPSTYLGFLLASGSLGENEGSDGLDMGIRE